MSLNQIKSTVEKTDKQLCELSETLFNMLEYEEQFLRNVKFSLNHTSTVADEIMKLPELKKCRQVTLNHLRGKIQRHIQIYEEIVTLLNRHHKDLSEQKVILENLVKLPPADSDYDYDSDVCLFCHGRKKKEYRCFCNCAKTFEEKPTSEKSPPADSDYDSDVCSFCHGRKKKEYRCFCDCAKMFLETSSSDDSSS